MLIWVVDPGLPGEINQCLGLANVLARRSVDRIEVIKLSLRSKTLGPLFSAALNANVFSQERPWLANIVYRLLFSGPPLGRDRPDLTVSTMGRGEVPAVFLRQFFGSFAVHIAVPKRMPSRYFDLIIRMPTRRMDPLDSPSVTIDIAPTPVLLENVKTYTSPLVERWRKQAHGLCAVLIGGDGSDYKYRRDEWRTLAQGLAELAQRQRLGLLLTTSRRTGADAVQELKGNAALQQSLVHADWFDGKSPSILQDYLAAADFVICTEESRSMISDAVAAGKRVYTVRPEQANLKEPRLVELLHSQEAAQRIKRIAFDQVGALDVREDALAYFKPRENCWSVELLQAIEKAQPNLWRMLREPSDADRVRNIEGQATGSTAL